MRKLLIAAITFASFNTSASPVGETIPGTGDDSYICINQHDQIELDGYFHYVFTADIHQGLTVEVKDYANDYHRIQTKVVTVNKDIFILENDDKTFVLAVDTREKSGALEHRGVKNYRLRCFLSGPDSLE